MVELDEPPPKSSIAFLPLDTQPIASSLQSSGIADTSNVREILYNPEEPSAAAHNHLKHKETNRVRMRLAHMTHVGSASKTCSATRASFRVLHERARSSTLPPDNRLIYHPSPTHDPTHHAQVVTSKYNIITFLPIFLFEMFSRVA